MSEKEYAVYAEASLCNKPAEEGFNRRVFNQPEVEKGQSICFDTETGVITLKTGDYHIVASSIITALGRENCPGYAVLRDKSVDLPTPTGEQALTSTDSSSKPDPKDLFLCTGTISNAGLATPSLIDTYVSVIDTMEIVVEHQVLLKEWQDILCNGERCYRPIEAFLQLDDNGSGNHIFARISIEKL